MNLLPKDGMANDAWEDDVLSDRPRQGMSREAAHRLLEMNPSLRAQGADTGSLVNQSAQARHRALQPATPSVPSPLSRAQDADHLLDLAKERFDQDQRELDIQLSMLQARIAGLKERHLLAVLDGLAALDANLSSPVTQEALRSHKCTLNALGFSAQRFVDRLREKREGTRHTVTYF